MRNLDESMRRWVRRRVVPSGTLRERFRRLRTLSVARFAAFFSIAFLLPDDPDTPTKLVLAGFLVHAAYDAVMVHSRVSTPPDYASEVRSAEAFTVSGKWLRICTLGLATCLAFLSVFYGVFSVAIPELTRFAATFMLQGAALGLLAVAWYVAAIPPVPPAVAMAGDDIG